MISEEPLILAAVDLAPGLYVDPIRIAIFAVLLILWALAAQWIDRDMDKVKTNREQWNVIVLSGAAVATFVLFVVPFPQRLFFVGAAFWVLLAGGAMAAYIVHRNGRLAPNARVLTVDHVKRVFGGGRDGRRPKDKGQRVQIVDHGGAFVELPEDPDEVQAFQALQDFLFDLLRRRVSEVDLVAGKETYRQAYRIDGVATEKPDGIAPDVGERIFRFVKKIAGLDIKEIRKPQKGKIQVSLLSHEGKVGDTEVYSSGTTAGERLRLRFHTDNRVYRLPELGMAGPRMELLKKILEKPHGLFLMSAPPQQGLTTAQYAILRSHDAYMNNIHALERRPLAEVDNITQQRFDGSNTDVNYARMLQTVLRREPNMVMVGECEDRETAAVALRAAGDGRKIYLGMQAKDSFDALGKFLALASDNALVARTLLGVMNQRLVRVVCPECREAFEPDPATLKKLNLPAEKIQRFYRPPSEVRTDRRGRPIECPQCQGTGFVGRTGVYELLVVDEAVSKLIAMGASTNRIKAQCRKSRMYYLQEEALLKVIDGTTSMDEILRCLRAG